MDVVAIEFLWRGDVTARFFSIDGSHAADLIVLIAPDWHMMWGEPTEYTTSARWRDWQGALSPAITHEVRDWRDSMADGGGGGAMRSSSPTTDDSAWAMRRKDQDAIDPICRGRQ